MNAMAKGLCHVVLLLQHQVFLRLHLSFGPSSIVLEGRLGNATLEPGVKLN
jgi:hypothetical protein